MLTLWFIKKQTYKNKS